MSPIRAERKGLYGKDWPAFSAEIRTERAGGRCECRGECGGLHDYIYPSTRRCPRRNGDLTARGTKIVLTVAHLCHDERCRKRRHVKAMCQRCHLRYDAHHHARNASATRDAKRGQERLAFRGELQG